MNLSEQTIGNLVAEDYRRATVFKGHGIDFCCGGGRTLAAVCEKKELNLADIEEELRLAEQGRGEPTIQPDTWTLSFLSDYIENHHHTYVRTSLPLLQEFTRKVARVHGVANPEVVEIADLVDELSTEMTAHMAKEEGILFPYVRQMESAAAPARSPFGSIRNPIRMMEEEHDAAGNIMKRIRSLSSDFSPPEHACNTYRVAYAKLEEFEDDLHRHIHLENNVLFPKASELEGDLAGA